MKAKDKLVNALNELKTERSFFQHPNCSEKLDTMITRASQGYYDEFEGELTLPLQTLVSDLRLIGANDLAQQVINGEFDADKEETEEWFQREGKYILFPNGVDLTHD